MAHYETHLYGYAVALTQGDKIRPENVQGMRDKALWHGHTVDECRFVKKHSQAYIKDGTLNWEDVGDQPEYHQRIHMICSYCGSTDVRKDAFAEWNVEESDWLLHSVYDACTCEKCETDTSIIELNEATQLEIQVFGMVEDGTDERQAKANETPNSFTVTVTTTPLRNGEILTLAEHDGLSYHDARRILGTHALAYPFAPITKHKYKTGAV